MEEAKGVEKSEYLDLKDRYLALRKRYRKLEERHENLKWKLFEKEEICKDKK